jgi:hypothetical protein
MAKNINLLQAGQTKSIASRQWPVMIPGPELCIQIIRCTIAAKDAGKNIAGAGSAAPAIPQPPATGDWLLLFRHAPEAELNEVFGFEFPAGPAISLLELNPELVTRPVELAVFDTGLAFVSGEFQRHNGSRRDGLFAFEAGA